MIKVLVKSLEDKHLDPGILESWLAFLYFGNPSRDLSFSGYQSSVKDWFREGLPKHKTVFATIWRQIVPKGIVRLSLPPFTEGLWRQSKPSVTGIICI